LGPVSQCPLTARCARLLLVCGAEAEARAAAEAAADAQRGAPPLPQRGFRLPMEAVPDLLMVWEFTQVGPGKELLCC
jgi:hypothetical protein